MTAPCVLRCFLHMSGKRWVIHIASPSPWRNPLPFGILNRSRSRSPIFFSSRERSPVPAGENALLPELSITLSSSSHPLAPWNANTATTNANTNAVGYKLHTGFSSGNYTLTTDLGNTTATTVQLTKSGSTYFFIVTAYNSAGTESPVSNQVSVTAP
jgi:hypothetical protein